MENLDKLNLRGSIRYSLTRGGKIILLGSNNNQICTEGKNNLLRTMFSAGTQSTLWYIGLINGGASLNAGTDIVTNHSGWTEFTGYTSSSRQLWTPGTVSNGSVTNPTQATFTMNAGTSSLSGIFITNYITAGDNTNGVIWSEAQFNNGAIGPIVSGDVLKVTYSLSC